MGPNGGPNEADGTDSGRELTRQVGWLRRLVGVMSPAARRHGLVAFSAAAGVVVATLLSPLIIARLLDGKGSRPLLLCALISLGAIRALTIFWRRWSAGQMSAGTESILRTSIHDHLQTLDPITHDALAQGQVVSRANADVGVIGGLLSFAPLLSSNLVQLVLSLGFMAVLSWQLTLVALVMVPPLVLISRQLRRWTFPANLDALAKVGDLTTRAEEAISGVRVVKGFGQERRELAAFEVVARELFGSRTRSTRITARWAPILGSIPVLGLVATLGIGGRLVMSETITVGTLVAFFTYLAQLAGPVRLSGIILTVTQQARAGAERIFELLAYRPAIVDVADAQPLLGGDGRISIRGAVVTYPGGHRALDGVSIEVNPGERIAIVGASGSGKSTVALAIGRFVELSSGSVLIDDQPIKAVTLASLRSRVSMVFEDAFLFSSTVRENLSFASPDASLETIVRAAKIAQAHEFIEALPNGYETVVGEQGLTLSGGQRQRLALARALVADPGVLVLDDATSALDTRTEHSVHEALDAIMEGRTVVLVAHRRSTLSLADRIVVMENGRVVDTGTYEELAARCRAFRVLLAEAGDDDVLSSGITQSGGLPPASPPRPVGGFVGGGFAGGPMGSGFALSDPGSLSRIDQLEPVRDKPNTDPESLLEEAMRKPKPHTWRSIAGRETWALSIALALVVADTLLGLAGPLFLRRGIDGGVKQNSETVLNSSVVGYLCVALLSVLIVRAQTLVAGVASERALYRLRVRVFGQLQRLSLEFYERELSGRLLTRVTSDIDALASFFQQGLIALLVNGFTLVGVTVVLLQGDLVLGLLALSGMPVLIVVTIWFRRVSSRAYDLSRDRLATVNARLSESFNGVRVVQAAGRESRNTAEFAAVVTSHQSARLAGQRANSIYFPVVEFVGVATTALVLGVGLNRVDDERVTIGALAAFVLYLNQFFSPIQQLSTVFDTWQQVGAANRKLAQLLSEPTGTPVLDEVVATPSHVGRIELRDVSFRYAAATAPALQGVNLIIEPGETIAVVGPTGAGKSTLLKLVARFYDPTAGAVLVGPGLVGPGSVGVDLRSLDLSSFRARIGMVPQEPVLFSGTIAENISYGKTSATRSDVEASARAVGADEVIDQLADRYDTVVSARGRSLSAGQRQLVALARAHLVDPQIFLLDEATSQLDLATEARVQQAMGMLLSAKGTESSREIAPRRTTILIAHRLETARKADRIVVLEAGRVVEIGTHGELVDLDGLYASLWASS